MEQSRQSAIEMIRKLFNVTEANGATEGEAINAALAAQRLIVKHGIEGWELAEEGERIEEVEASRAKAWQTSLAGIIADNFRCKVYVRSSYRPGARRASKSVVFYGYRADAEAASLVYERLSRIGEKIGRHYASRRAQLMGIREGREVSASEVFNAWAAAFVLGINDELAKQSHELMIVCPKAVSDAFEQMSAGWGRERNRSRYHGDRATAEAGRRTGRDSVRSGRIEAARPGRLLTA